MVLRVVMRSPSPEPIVLIDLSTPEPEEAAADAQKTAGQGGGGARMKEEEGGKQEEEGREESGGRLSASETPAKLLPGVGRVSAYAAARRLAVLTQRMVLPEGPAHLMGTGSLGSELNLKEAGSGPDAVKLEGGLRAEA
eukprot:729229-Rhodomonas_salina.3